MQHAPAVKPDVMVTVMMIVRCRTYLWGTAKRGPVIFRSNQHLTEVGLAAELGFDLQRHQLFRHLCK